MSTKRCDYFPSNQVAIPHAEHGFNGSKFDVGVKGGSLESTFVWAVKQGTFIRGRRYTLLFMSRFRDNTNRIVLMLGALFFLFISSNLQACVLAGGDCVNMQQVQSQAMMEMHCHVPASSNSQIRAAPIHSTQLRDIRRMIVAS